MVPDELRDRLEPVLRQRERRIRCPDHTPLPDAPRSRSCWLPLLDAMPSAYLAFRWVSRGFGCLDRSYDVRITSDPIPKSPHT